MVYEVWVHGQRGNAHRISALNEIDAIQRVSLMKEGPFRYYSGEVVELVAAPVLECGDLGYPIEKTVTLA
jgi:hypothetical protein